MYLAGMESVKKRHLLKRSYPELLEDIMFDSELADRGPDHKLSVKCLQSRAHNILEKRRYRIAGLLMAGSIPECRGFGISNCSYSRSFPDRHRYKKSSR